MDQKNTEGNVQFTKQHTTVRTAASAKQKAQELLETNSSPQRALREAVRQRNRHHTQFWHEVVQHLNGTITENQEPEIFSD